MNLFLRLMALLIRNALGHERIGYLDEAVLNFRVWITDQDAFMHMNNSRYNSICDLGGLDLMTRIGVLGPMRRAGYVPVIVYRGVTLHRMLRFPDAYSVHSRVIGWDGPYVCFQHDFIRKSRLCAEAISIGRMVGKHDDKPDIDTILAALDLPAAPERPPLPEACRMKIEEIEAVREKRRLEKLDKLEKSLMS